MPNINVLNEIQIKQDNNTTTSYKVGTVNGYYNPTNGKFYKEYPYVNEIEGASNLVYVDLGGNKLYVYKNSSFVNVSGSGGGSADNIVFGYYKEADGKFYEDSSYTTEIVPNLKNLYINLTDETIFRYDATNSEYVEISEAIDYSSEINSLSTENSTQTSEINSLSQSASEIASTASTHTSQISSLSTASSELASEYTVINSEVSKFNSNLTANNIPFKFGYDSTTQKYGYIINEGGADTVIPFKTIQTSKTVTAGTSTSTVTPDSGYDGIGSITVNPTPSQSKTVTSSTSAQTVTPDSGKLLSSVTVNEISTQTKSASPSTSAQTITPDSGKLLSSVTVNAISPDRTTNSMIVPKWGTDAGSSVPATEIAIRNPRIDFNNNTTYGNAEMVEIAMPQGYYAWYWGQSSCCIPTESKTVTPSASTQTITPTGYNTGGNYVKFLKSVTVNPISNSGTYIVNKVGTADMGSTNTYRYVGTSPYLYLCSLTARVFEPTSSAYNKQLSFYKSSICLNGSDPSYPSGRYSSSYLTGTTATYTVTNNVQFRFTFTYSVSNSLGTLYVTKIEVYNNSGSSIQAFANMFSPSSAGGGYIYAGTKISSNATWTTISNSTQGWAASQDSSYSSASAAYYAIGTGSLLFGYVSTY